MTGRPYSIPIPPEQQLPDNITYMRALILVFALALMAVSAKLLPEWSGGYINTGVALVYLTIFFVTLGRLGFPFWMSMGARAFFLGCAGVHLDLAVHAFMGISMSTAEFHHQFFDILQNVGGWTFVVGAIYFRTRVVDLRTAKEKRLAALKKESDG